MTHHSMVTRIIRSVIATLGLVTLLGIQACGGGSSTPPPPPQDANPTGYYSNNGIATVKEDDNVTDINITDLQAMVYNNRLMMMSVQQDLVYDGTITVSQNDFSGTVTIYRNRKINPILPVCQNVR